MKHIYSPFQTHCKIEACNIQLIDKIPYQHKLSSQKTPPKLTTLQYKLNEFH